MYISRYIVVINLKPYVLLINGLNGHIDLIDHITWLKVKRDINSHISTNAIEYLTKRQYIFKDLLTESEQVKKIEERIKYILYKNNRIVININITEDCNLQCPYCINWKRHTKEHMTKSQIDRIFQGIETLGKKYKIYRNITLLGGEPLMSENRDILEYLFKKSGKYKFNIVTNGVTIDEYIRLFKNYRNKITDFQITLDGPPEIHDKIRIGKDYPNTFKTITSNIQKLIDLKINVNIRTNVDGNNIDYLPELAGIFNSRGWNKSKYIHPYIALISSFHIDSCENSKTNPVKYIAKLRGMKDKYPSMRIYNEERLYSNSMWFLINVLRKKRNITNITYCKTTGGCSFTFASDGCIYSCPAAVGINDFLVGKYYPKLNWNRKVLKKWKRRLSTNMEKCKKCPLIFICGGNCPLDAYNKNKDVYHPVCYGGIKTLEKFVKLNKDRILKFAKDMQKGKKKQKK